MTNPVPGGSGAPGGGFPGPGMGGRGYPRMSR